MIKDERSKQEETKKLTLRKDYQNSLEETETSFTIKYDQTLDSKKKATAITHELAHLILNIKGQQMSPQQNFIARIRMDGELRYLLLRDEVRAWRLAKSICKSKLWDEKLAVKSLLTYFYPPKAWNCFIRWYVKKISQEKRKMRKIGIIPYYKQKEVMG